MNNPENLLCRFLIMRHLHRHRARARDCLDKESRGNIGRDPHLPRFQHNVAMCTGARKFQLRMVGAQTNQFPCLAADSQQTLDQQIADGYAFTRPPAPRLFRHNFHVE
jgi:hypothetical protein